MRGENENLGKIRKLRKCSYLAHLGVRAWLYTWVKAWKKCLLSGRVSWCKISHNFLYVEKFFIKFMKPNINLSPVNKQEGVYYMHDSESHDCMIPSHISVGKAVLSLPDFVFRVGVSCRLPSSVMKTHQSLYQNLWKSTSKGRHIHIYHVSVRPPSTGPT